MKFFEHFAYGSNLSSRRLRERCPGAQPQAVGYVRCRQLRFHKIGLDGTGKADAFPTGSRDDVLWGVVYRSPLHEKIELDRCESLGNGYEQVTVEVHVGDRTWTTYLYQAQPHRIDFTLKPAPWYHQHVLQGAREHALPTTYQQMIASFALHEKAAPPGGLSRLAARLRTGVLTRQ